jgi:UDP-glucose 4-epimerase
MPLTPKYLEYDDSMKIKWLLLGGAGFIGSHVARAFRESEVEFLILDNFSTGEPSRVVDKYEFIEGDGSNRDLIIDICRRHNITGILNLAAFMQARESIREPIKYWRNNLGVSLAIAEASYSLKLHTIILSSSCSVYGNAENATVDTSLNPLSPYAYTKVASEQVLAQACADNDCDFVSLRYFNVIGGGDFPNSVDTKKETLVPSVFNKIANGDSPVIFGSDFLTKDGTCERDFIDVRDLADAHVKVAEFTEGFECPYINVSTGVSVSVLEVVNHIIRITDSSLKPQFVQSKKGDPAKVSAMPSPQLLQLGWRVKYNIEESISNHWKFVNN